MPSLPPAKDVAPPGPEASICRYCLCRIWNEGGSIGHVRRYYGWSDRIERGGDSLVCFSALNLRHVPVSEESTQ